MRLLNISIILFASQIATAQDGTEIALQRIFQEYQSMKASPDVGNLVLLDQELRFLIIDPWDRDHSTINAKYFKPGYDSIGLSTVEDYGVYYSGKLLAEAHRMDPNSRYREYTFYSTILSEAYSADPPQIDSAKAYLREFPQGPYIFHAVRILAEFYDDVYKAIRGQLRGGSAGDDFAYFSPFMSNKPLKEQLSEVQKVSSKYYLQAIRLRPSDKDLQTFYDELMNGESNGWFFYPD